MKLSLSNLKCVHRWQCVAHHGHTAAHGTYLGAVAHEAHGLYGKAALVLLIFVVLGALMGDKDEE